MWLGWARVTWDRTGVILKISQLFQRIFTGDILYSYQRKFPQLYIVACLAFWSSIHVYYQHPLPPGLARAEFVQFRAAKILTKPSPAREGKGEESLQDLSLLINLTEL